MSSPIRVMIATTEGPLPIERIIGSPLKKSKVYDWNGTQPLETMSALYHAFVSKRVTRIPTLARDQTFRLDISGEIDVGESWQLAIFTAHALQSIGRFAGREPEEDAGTTIVATGLVDEEFLIGEVGSVEDKLAKLFDHAALRQTLERGRRVIVALPEANGGDGKAEQDKLRKLGVELLPVANVEALLEALELKKLVMQPANESDPWEGSPFRGLEVFDRRHRRIFCGRGKAREEALERLRRQDRAGCGFLLIHGSSGVGKSSLARAGLLGDIEQMSNSIDRWRTAIMVPSRGRLEPMSALADVLIEGVPELAFAHLELVDLMRNSPSVAAEAVAAALGKAHEDGCAKLALLVDQIDELLIWARERNAGEAIREREAFAEMLDQLARSRAVWVIATLRSDLLTLLEDSPALSNLASNDRLYRLERPRRGALKEIITRPAELAGLKFVGRDKDDMPFVDVLTEAARGQQDCLPLLQFALKLLYDDDTRRTGKISYEKYLGIGELADAIGAWADKTVKALGEDPETSRAVDDVILNLGRRGRESDLVVANEVSLDASFLTPARENVINALDQARLVVIDAGAGDRRRMVRVAHEALLTHWPRARTLFEAHAVALALKEDLERSAIRWKNEGEDKVFLIPGGRPLAEAQVLLADGRVALTKLAGAYINASLAEHRVAIENVKAQLARDEQKIADHLKSAEYREAEIELQSVVGYLSEETDIDLRDRAARFTEQLGRMSRLAIFSTAARSVYSLAGEENFEKAPGVCESALRAIGMFDDPEWWEHLPVEGLDPGQIEDLRQDIYRSLLLFSALQLVPGIRKLFPGRQAGPPKPRRSIDPTKFARLIPNFVLAAIIRRGGFGSFRLPTRRDNPRARVEFDNSLAVLKQVWRVEEARAKEAGKPSQRSRASELVERIAQVLAEFSSGPKGASVDYERWLLAAAPAEPPEPVNAVDYFFIGLFNYYIAKRSDDAAVAKIISLLQGSFPDLDARAPLATAERLLRTAIALEPRNFWPHWVLGRTLLQGGAPAAAELAFNAAIALQPDYARGYEQRALALANQWAEVGDDRLRNRARDDSRKALAVAKGDPSVFWPRGEMLERLGEIREAVGAYSLWLELEDDLLAKIARGAGVVRLYELALKLLADTSAVGLHADAHALLALVYWTWKDYKSDASRAAASALAIDPAHPHALAVTGVVLLELGRVSEALDRGLEPALRFDPHNDWVLLNRARAVELEYGSEAALAAWQRLLDRAATVTAPCPPWMKDVAEAAVSRIGAAMRAPQPQTAVA